MTTLNGKFTDAIGGPGKGYITLQPTDIRESRLVIDSMVGIGRVRVNLDGTGAFSVNVEPGEYKVTVNTTGERPITALVAIPDASTAIPLMSLLTEYLAVTVNQIITVTTAGSYQIDIPWWATYIDYVLLGGGAGGDDGTTLTVGKGGQPGEWTLGTLERGVDVPWTTTHITGVVGSGGAHNEGAGGSSTASGTGMTTVTAAGGPNAQASSNPTGVSPGSRTLNGMVCTGGGPQTSHGHDGNGPGGGGGGGEVLNAWGGKGAAGAVWFRMYR
jgi:hypothetical protein